MIEMVIPSALDPSVAPQGKHVISLFTQYTPFYLDDGREWTAKDKLDYAENGKTTYYTSYN